LPAISTQEFRTKVGRGEPHEAALMHTELVAYELAQQEDPEQAKKLARELHALVADCVSRSPGVMVRSTEATQLIEFPGVVGAARCALDIQFRIAARNATVPTSRRLAIRIGLHFAAVTPMGGDLKGDEVDLLVVLGRQVPEVGGICVSQVVRDGLRDQPGFSFDDLGKQAVSGRTAPEHLYLISIAGGPARSRSLEQPRVEPPEPSPATLAHRRRRVLPVGIGIGVVVAGVAVFASLKSAAPPPVAPPTAPEAVAAPAPAPTPELAKPPELVTPLEPAKPPEPVTPSAAPSPREASAEPPAAAPAKTMLERLDDVLARVEKLPKSRQKKLLPDLKQWKAVERLMKRGKPGVTVNPRVLARLERSLDEIDRAAR
jgi:class 3 adenylate cyclase